jgi:diguanylate cyclase (GGDEF)-like protein/PAS domain S-box-containing protein
MFWVWMAALLCAYYVLDRPITVWAAIGLSSSIAVVVGVRRYRPRRSLPWLLMALALLLLTVGDTDYFAITHTLGQTIAFPSLPDVFYLATYPFLIAGLLLLPRSTTARDRGGIVDALILTAGLGLLAWIFVIAPALRDETRSATNHLASVAYPLFDVLFLAAAARLLATVRRTNAVTLLAAGGVALLITDVLYSASQLDQHARGIGGPVDVGWIVFYAMWGAAALHPSMYDLTEPRIVRDTPVTPGRLVVLTLAALVAPVVLFVEPIRGSNVDAIPIAVLSAALFLLVMLRLAGVVGNYRQATGRERILREAGEAMVAATDVEAVRHEAIAATGRLFPEGADYEVVLPLKHETRHDESIDADLRQAVVSDPLPTRFIRTADIQADSVRHAMREHEIALVVPLMLTDRAVGEPLIGTLVVAAGDQQLALLQSSIEVVAGQAALAIERIELSAEVARRDSEQYFRTLVQSTADVILIVDDDQTVRYASPSATTLFGDVPVAGRPLPDVLAMKHSDIAGLPRAGSDLGYWVIERPDGERAEVEVSARDLRGDPTVNGLVLTVRDVTQRQRLERELTYLAFHDSLTGLANRVRFNEQVQHAVAAAGPDDVVGVLFVDVDDFKVVNDTMGHDVGDRLLQEVARRLSDVVSEDDLPARLGGDEFAILVRRARTPSDVEDVAEQVVAALTEPVIVDGSLLNASASIGVATTEDARGKGDLLRHADLALYVAKGSGKSRWRRFQSVLHAQVVKRLELRAALDRAVANEEFTLAYQPIVALATGAPVGFEALLRWDDPGRGLVLPGEFIEVAEDSGLIVPIGNWALHQAFADAAGWASGVGPAAVPEHQRLGPPVPQPRAGRDDRAGAARQRTAGQPAAARDHREPAAARRRTGVGRPGPAA